MFRDYFWFYVYIRVILVEVQVLTKELNEFYVDKWNAEVMRLVLME